MALELANVICIKWGEAFGPEYVNRLYSGARRNIAAPVRFLCMTEHASGLHPDIEVLNLPVEPFHDVMNAELAKANRFGAMRKISLFRPGLIPNLTGPVLGFDLDVVITGDLTPLLTHAPGDILMRHDWVEARKGRSTGHGSVFRFDPCIHGFLYDEFAVQTVQEVRAARGSEQRYTSHKAMDWGCFSYIPEPWVVSFKYQCLGLPPVNYLRAPILPKDARVVCFHGRPKMPEAVAGYRGSLIRFSRGSDWLKDHWIDRSCDDLGAKYA